MGATCGAETACCRGNINNEEVIASGDQGEGINNDNGGKRDSFVRLKPKSESFNQSYGQTTYI